MIQLGLRAALVCMAMSEYVTVGVIQKACEWSRQVSILSRGMAWGAE